MKIAIASLGKNQQSQISNQAARAPYYLIFNEKGELLETIKNPFSVGGGGAGFAAAKMLADKEINLVIANNFGQNMIGALEERGLKFEEKSGSIEDIIKTLA